jgi:hypothetical protein
MKGFFLTGISVLVLSGAIFAQNEQDALRYSRIGFGGTARFSSMGGAFGALGADMSTLSTNPAGLGFYHKNEITFTPSFYNQTVNSNYNSNLTSDSRFNFRFDNFGFVFAGKTDNTSETGWQTMGLGIAYNRYSSFQADMRMEGNSTTSLMDSWARTAGGSGPYNLDQYNEGLGWNTYLLNNLPGDTTHYTDTIPDGDLLAQSKTVTMRGGMGEWVFGIGGNYSNKFYVGASVGIPQVKYEEIDHYTEKEVNDTTSNFDYLEFNQNLDTRGRGFNFKFGVVYRPVDMVRVGFAFHSPSVLKLTDSYGASMSSVVGGTSYQYAPDDGSFNYTIRTPMRMIGSLAVIIGKVASISGDYEIVDYSEAQIKSSTYGFSTANENIKTKYTAASNIRIGTEVRLLPLTLRAGFAYYGSPYANGINNNAARLYLTGGVGYRDPDDQFFVDLGVVTTSEKSNYYFYDQSLVNPVNNTSKVVNVVLTCGFRY